VEDLAKSFAMWTPTITGFNDARTSYIPAISPRYIVTRHAGSNYFSVRKWLHTLFSIAESFSIKQMNER
jgi:hypothetical protein